VNTAAKFVRKFIERGVAVDLDGALGGVANDVAVMAPLQMFLELGPGAYVHRVVEIIGQLS
jgi:hypothetical protein